MSKKSSFAIIVLYVVMCLLFIDLLGAIAWRTSGQVPPDGFHAGIITESVHNYGLCFYYNRIKHHTNDKNAVIECFYNE